MNPAEKDWMEILVRVESGDRRAFLELSRLITYVLSGMRAYDFQSEWDDVVQDVVVSTLRAVNEGRVRDSTKLLAYIRAVTRNRFIDRFRRGRRRDRREEPFEESTVEIRDEPSGQVEMNLTVRNALAGLPPRERDCIVAVYVRGQTYDEAADTLDVPLGSLKRFLRQGLASLRRHVLSAEGE